MTLIAPLEEIQADRMLPHPQYRDLWMLLHQEGVQDAVRAEVKVRGNFRKHPETCEWPPLKLKLKKGDVASPVIGTHRKLKLVTNCQGEQFIRREYMIYKLYEVLSPESFRVRLVELTLQDAQGEIPESHQLAFLIEDKEAVAARLKLPILEGGRVVPGDLDLKQYARLALFQYMIGNRDWDVYSEKNVAVFGTAEQAVAIPFDFDFSGSVAVSYSDLEGYELRNWRTICWDPALQEAMRLEFLAVIPVWKDMIASDEHLSAADRRTMLAYFRPFFKFASKADQWQEKFPSTCE